MEYKFKVIYTVKHINKKSALYNMISENQTCKFGSLQSAIKYVRDITGYRNSKIQVMGKPTIERIQN